MCIHQQDTYAGQRTHPLRRALLLTVAVGSPVAPPVNVPFLSQREGVNGAGGHGDELQPRFRQSFDPPG